jgi:uncharacterized protein (TIGR03437 family)
MRFFWAFLVSFPLLASDVAIAPASLTFAYQINSQVLASQAIAITGPQSTPFTVTRPLDQGWIILPSGTASFSTTTPAVLPIGIDPRALTGGTSTAAITLRFPDGSITVPVTVSLSASPILVTSPGALVFDSSSLAIPSQGFVAAVSNSLTTSTSASTTTPWLRVEGANSFVVTVDRTKAGTALNSGAVQVHSSPLRPVVNDPWNVPVIYFGNGLGSRGPLTFDPPALTFAGTGSQTFPVSGGAFTASSDAKWLTTKVSGQNLTAAVDPAGLVPGSYQATVTMTSGGVLQMLPVTLSTVSPQFTAIVNAASYAQGAISPGEIVTLFGTALGPANGAGLTLDAGGAVSTTLAGVRVLFDGVAAPLVYVSGTQISAVAPYELEGKSNTAVHVVYSGQISNEINVPVTGAAPGIFTADASGKGPAATFRTGDILSIYMTGEGQTTPAGINGKVTVTPPIPRLPVTATLDGAPAEVQFYGEAPGVVSGVMQVNVRIPANARSGELPLVVSVGGVPSQNGVTVSVR